MLTRQQQEAVKAFEQATAEFVIMYGGVPHCPKCGGEGVPNPLPWIVGPNTWSCISGQWHGDFSSRESRVPPRDWAPAQRHPPYIHDAFRRRTAGGFTPHEGGPGIIGTAIFNTAQ